jgi:hypothetical protein
MKLGLAQAEARHVGEANGICRVGNVLRHPGPPLMPEVYRRIAARATKISGRRQASIRVMLLPPPSLHPMIDPKSARADARAEDQFG